MSDAELRKQGRFTWLLVAFSALVILFMAQQVRAATGFFGDGSGGAIFYDTLGSTSGEGTYKAISGGLDGFNYGEFSVGSTSLLLRGGEAKTYKNNGGDVYGTTLYYRIFKTGSSTSGLGFTTIGLGWNADLGNGDQRWKTTSANINLIGNRSESGSWTVEYYWGLSGNQGTPVLNDNGNYYQTYYNLYYNLDTSSTISQSATGGAAVFSGDGKFVKKGLGTVQITNANSGFSGAVYLDAGSLEVGSGAGLGSGQVFLGPETGSATGSLKLTDSDGGLTLANQITVRSPGAGSALSSENISGTNTFSGNLALGANSKLSATNGGHLSLTGSTLNFSNSTILTVTNSGNVTIANQLITSGDALLEKRGEGTLKLSGGSNYGDLRFDLYGGKLQVDQIGNLGSAGSYKGNKIYFSGGTLWVTNSFTLGANNGITIGASGGTIEVDGGKTLTIQEYINDQSNSGVSFYKTGSGTLFLDKSGSMDFSGTTLKVVDGTLSTWNPSGNLSSSVELGSSSGSSTTGTYRFQKSDGGSSTGANFAINSGGGKIDVGADPLTVSGNLTGSGSFSKIGNGTLELTGSGNTHSGATTVEAGTLKLNRSSGGAALAGSSIAVNSGGTLLLGAANQIGNDTAVTMAGGTLAMGGFSDTVGTLKVDSASTFNFGNAGASTSSFTFSGIDLSTYAGGAAQPILTLSGVNYGSTIVFNTAYANTGSFNTFVSKISFSDTSLNAGISFGSTGSTTTLTVAAIPEPKVYIAAGVLLALIGCTEYRRRRQVCRK